MSKVITKANDRLNAAIDEMSGLYGPAPTMIDKEQARKELYENLERWDRLQEKKKTYRFSIYHDGNEIGNFTLSESSIAKYKDNPEELESVISYKASATIGHTTFDRIIGDKQFHKDFPHGRSFR